MGIGFDRAKTGSDAVDQYCPEVAEVFGSLKNCPEEELLWFHHLPWAYKMRSGKTLWEELCYHYYLLYIEALKELRRFKNFGIP
jgi:alpha-glucuronidase